MSDDYATPGAELLDELRAALLRYVVLPTDEAADAVALWIAATHAQPAWEHAPRLVITAPEKRCGKSRLLDIVEATCHEPIIAVNVSVAAVTRSITEDPPTLLVDEADAYFGPKAKGDREEMRGILNAGHQRNRPSLRYNAERGKVEKLNTFAMAALAGIGDMPDTIMDRAVVVRMRRRAPGETVSPFRTRRDRPALEALAERIHEWARANLDQLTDMVPDMPVEDRAADTWEPLVAIAEVAGGDWPKRSRAAAEAFVNAAEDAAEDASLSVRLLSDLREVFGDADRLRTSTILERLHAVEDAPWGDYFGRPFTARDLSSRLRPYGITPKDVREDGTGPNRKGYTRAQFWDAWQRYLPAKRDSRDKGDIAGQPRRGQIHVADGIRDNETSATALTSNVAGVAGVADIATETPECLDCGRRTEYLSPTTLLCANCT